jgi:hypothetical protein
MDSELLPTIHFVARDIMTKEWTAEGEIFFFSMLNLIPEKNMTPETVAFIKELVARPILLPESVELAGIDRGVVQAHYKTLTKNAAQAVLRRLEGGK